MSSHITLLNLYPLDEFDRSFLKPNMEAVVGDGCSLPYADGSFDIVFSNSVIEHLGEASRQHLFVSEARRVGRGYWVQTPAMECVMESHFFTPFIHWFPKRIQKRLLRNFTVWGLMERPNPDDVDSVLRELRLLNRAEFQTLFPDGQVWVERLIGMPKSYTAYKLPAPSPAAATSQRTEIHAQNGKANGAYSGAK